MFFLPKKHKMAFCTSTSVPIPFTWLHWPLTLIHADICEAVFRYTDVMVSVDWQVIVESLALKQPYNPDSNNWLMC